MNLLLHLLRAQKTGVLCALAAALLLATGSVVMDLRPDAYADLHHDDLGFFLASPSPLHAWLYALAGVIALWSLSTLVSTWDSLRTRLRARIVRPSAYGVPLVHLCFVGAVVAHAWGGLGGAWRHHVVSGPTEIAGREVRLVSVARDRWPDGTPRRTTVTLERRADGRAERVTLRENAPVLDGLGATALLLQRTGAVGAATLRVGDEAVTLGAGERARLRSGATVTVHRVITSPSLRVPVVDYELSGGAPARALLPYDPDATTTPAFVGIAPRPAVALLERHNPSIPMVVALSALLTLGVALAAWEHVGRRAHRAG